MSASSPRVNEKSLTTPGDIVVFALSCVSVLATSFVVHHYSKAQHRTMASVMMFLICLANLLWSFNVITTQIVFWSTNVNFDDLYGATADAGARVTTAKALCGLQGFFTTVFYLTTFVLSFQMILLVYHAIVKQRVVHHSGDERLRVNAKFMTFIVGLILLTAALPLTTQSYQPVLPNRHQNCFISFQSAYDSLIFSAEPGEYSAVAGTVWRVTLLLVPYPLVLAFQCFALWRVRQRLHAQALRDKVLTNKVYLEPEEYKAFFNFVLLYPSTLLVCWIVLYALRFAETVNSTFAVDAYLAFPKHSTAVTVYYVAYALVSCAGPLNVMLYYLALRGADAPGGVMAYASESDGSQRKKQPNTGGDWPDKDSGNISLIEDSFLGEQKEGGGGMHSAGGGGAGSTQTTPKVTDFNTRLQKDPRTAGTSRNGNLNTNHEVGKNSKSQIQASSNESSIYD